MLKHADDDLLAVFARVAHLLKAVVEAPGGFDAAVRVVRYALLVKQTLNPEEIGAVIAPELGTVGEEVVMTAGQRLIEQGHIAGRTEGLQEGRTEGQRRALHAVLHARFGTPDALIEAKLAPLDGPALEACLLQSLQAESFEALFAVS